MTNSQREWLTASKSIFEFTNKIVAPVLSGTLLFASVVIAQYLTTSLTKSALLGDMVFYTLIFLFGLNILSSQVYNYLSNKLRIQYLKDYLKNTDEQSNSDRGHSRDDSGSGQPNSQDKTQ